MSEASATLSLDASKFDSALRLAQQNLNGFADNLASSFSSQLVGKLTGITAGILSVGAAFNTLQSALSSGVALNSSLEQTKLSVATLLNQFDGSRFADFNDRMGESERILGMLRTKGMQAEGTFAQLTDTLKQSSGGMFSSGIRDGEKQVDVIVAMSQALGALGGDQATLATELRGITSGNIDGMHRVAKAIGLSGAEAKKAASEGKLYNLLMERLKPILADAGQGMDTFASRTTQLAENIDNLKTDLAQPMFEAIKDGLEEVNSVIAGTDFKDAFKGLAGSLGDATKSAMGFIGTILKVVPTIASIGSTITSMVIPALLMMGAAKLKASGSAATLNSALMNFGRGGIATATNAWKTFQYNMVFTPTITGKVTQAFTLMTGTISRSISAMATSVKAQFMGMMRSGQLAALGIQAAMALAMAGYMAAMNYANELNATTGEQKQSIKGQQARDNENSRDIKSVESEEHRTKILDKFAGQKDEVNEKISAVEDSDKSDANKATLIEQYKRELFQIELHEGILKRITAERMKQNLVAREAADLAEKEKQRIGELSTKAKEAKKDLDKDSKSSALGELKPEEQRTELFNEVFGDSAANPHTNKELDSQIESTSKKVDAGTATVAETEFLIKLIAVKKQMLDLDKKIASERSSLKDTKSKDELNKLKPAERRSKLLYDALPYQANQTSKELDSRIEGIGKKVDAGTATDFETASLMKMIEAKKQILAIDKELEKSHGDIKESQKKDAFDKLTPKEQKAQLLNESLGDGAPKTGEELDSQIESLHKKTSDGTATADETAALMKMIDAKKQLLSVEKELENQKKSREEFDKEQGDDLKIKGAQAKGDDREAQRLEDEQKKANMVKKLKEMGFTDKDANSRADKGMKADQAVKGFQDKTKRDDFSSELEKQRLLGSGDKEGAEKIDLAKKRKSLVKEQKDMGFSEEDANNNADKMLLYEQQQKDLADKEKVQKAGPLAASSMMAIGGGGVSVGMGGGDQMLNETKRQTGFLQKIAEAVARNSRDTIRPSRQPWESRG